MNSFSISEIYSQQFYTDRYLAFISLIRNKIDLNNINGMIDSHLYC